jgi:hypothetical protein
MARLLCDHSIPLAAVAALCFMSLALIDAARGLGSNSRQRQRLTHMQALLAAEEAAGASVHAKSELGVSRPTSWGLSAKVERVRDVEDRLEITVATARTHLRYGCECLRGAAPRCFAKPLTLGDAGDVAAAPSWLRGASSLSGSLPQLALPPGPHHAVPGLFADTEVAFLHLAAGTDRADYTWGGLSDHVAIPAQTDVAEVAGNLWLLPQSRPLRVVLAAPLTIVVRGNLYIGRTLDVVGGVPLTIVAARAGASFRDLDGDGAHDAGEPVLGSGRRAVEGEGSVYFGLPGNAADPGDIEIDAHIVAEGEVHLRSISTAHGAIVSAHSLTRCTPGATLTLTGRRLLEAGRARVPGFATSGSPRPGVLRPLPSRD